MRKFNVTGVCVPTKDYMVDISGKLEQIMRLIDDGCYFTINRARQYGKTTTLSRIQNTLAPDYLCARISFQGVSGKSFETEERFCKMFLDLVYDSLQFSSAAEEYIEEWPDPAIIDFNKLNRHLTKLCKYKKVVLLIDEVDQTSHNRIFLRFIGMLREKFLMRREDMDYTFSSVILAGVYDIKNIKLKMINEGVYIPAETENKIYNSPWNIATDFNVEMSFCPVEIATMLIDYEADHKTGMNIVKIAEEIYKYTSGYPFLVSRICKHIDEKLNKDWSLKGIQNAIKSLLTEKNTLFDDLFKNLENNKDLSNLIYDLLILREVKPFVIYDPVVNIGAIYGFLNDIDNNIAISNKIFELLMINYYISKDLRNKKQSAGVLQRDLVRYDNFDMELCLRKFASHYAEIYSMTDKAFLERHGRLLFLSYLRPLINGQGFYHIESQLIDLRRMDIVVDYGRQQFIIELKLWNGQVKQAEAYTQLCGYLESKSANTGYLLTFDFREEGNKVRKAEWVEIEGKCIFDVMV